MGFEVGRRRGSMWDDVNKINDMVINFPFHTTGKSEKSFENGFSTAILTNQNNFENEIITQIDKTTTVKSIYCFGKNHRPDLTINNDGIAIEIKFVKYDGLKEAIGQGYLYRFILIVILSK